MAQTLACSGSRGMELGWLLKAPLCCWALEGRSPSVCVTHRGQNQAGAGAWAAWPQEE